MKLLLEEDAYGFWVWCLYVDDHDGYAAACPGFVTEQDARDGFDITAMALGMEGPDLEPLHDASEVSTARMRHSLPGTDRKA